MNYKFITLNCSEYTFKGKIDLTFVSRRIDQTLKDNFVGKQVVLRGIQSAKHDLPKNKLIKHIEQNGSDRYDEPTENINQVNVSDKHIDLFGLGCRINKYSIITLPILEGFHKWAPKALERPQRKVDIWMIYDTSQLENVEYKHSHYGVKAKDGYIFKHPENKKGALLGIIEIE